MEHTLSFYSTTLYRDFFAYTTERLQTLGLSFGQLPFVLYVGNHSGCTPGELNAALHIDWGHTQRTLSRLADDGFLRKEPNPKDRRTCNLTLTPQGQEAFRISHQVFFTWDDQKTAHLTQEEKSALYAILAKLTHPSEAN